MRKVIIWAAVGITVVGLAGAAIAGTRQLRSTATGAEEIPLPNPVSTAEADLKLKIAADGMSVRFDLRVTESITDVTQSHLHRPNPGALTGPIAVWLYPHPSGPLTEIPGAFDGRLSRGVIVPEELCFSATAPYCPGGVTPNWEAFLTDLEAGVLYLNLHTTQNPPGEIRGAVEAHPHH
jgi:CHRD domain